MTDYDWHPDNSWAQVDHIIPAKQSCPAVMAAFASRHWFLIVRLTITWCNCCVLRQLIFIVQTLRTSRKVILLYLHGSDRGICTHLPLGAPCSQTCASLSDRLGVKDVFDVSNLAASDTGADTVVAIRSRSDKIVGESRVERLDICEGKSVLDDECQRI